MKILSLALAVGCLEIRKNADDPRRYEGLVLANQLKVLLVSDPSATQAAVSLVLSSGSQDDPPHLKGMAHFCEHMMHMGSAAYPDEDAYYQYVTSNGGTFSATTGYNYTTYGFHVNPPALATGLEMLASLFTSPLLRPSSVAREIKIIQKEYDYRSPMLAFKLYAVSYTAANRTHPYAQFRIGNTRALAAEAEARGLLLHEQVRNHYNTYYSANLMQLVVIAPASLDEIKAMVTTPFSRLPNHNRPASDTGSPFGPQHLAIDITANLNTEERGIVFEFILPPFTAVPTETIDYLASYLTRSDAGSFLAAQKKKGNVLAIDAQFKEVLSSFTIFHIAVVPSSLAVADDITRDLFSYLAVIRQEAITQERYSEHTRRAEQEGSVLDKHPLATLALYMALTSHLGTPLQDIVVSLDEQVPFDATAMRGAIDQLSPRAMRRILYSPAFEASQTDEWFHYTYSHSPIPHSLLEELESPPALDTHLPKTRAAAAPKAAAKDAPAMLELVHAADLLRFWHIGEPKELEKSAFSLTIADVQRHPTWAETMRVRLLANLVNEKASEITGDIVYGGHKVSFQTYQTKMVVNLVTSDVRGSLASLLKLIRALDVSPEEFDAMKNQFHANLDLTVTKSPASQAYALLNSALVWGDLPVQVAKQSLHELDYTEFRAWFQSLLSCNRADALLVGQEDAAPILDLLRDFQSGFGECVALPPFPKKVVFSGEHVVQRNLTSPGLVDSAVAFYLDLYSDDSIEHAGLCLLIEALVKTDFFDQIRTREGLGYLLQALHTTTSGGGGLLFYVQSTAHPTFLESRIEAFLDSFVARFERMPAPTFEAKREALLQARRASKPGLTTTYNRYWSGILTDNLDFQRGTAATNTTNHTDHRITSFIATVSQQQLLGFMRIHLLKSSPLRRKLSVHMLQPNNHPAAVALDAGLLRPDPLVWKRQVLAALE